MARFDVHINPGKKAFPFLVDVQTELLRDIKTRVVVPLSPASGLEKEKSERLKPLFMVGDRKYILLTTEIAAVPVALMGPVVASLAEKQFEITAALDFLFQGF